MENIRKNIMMPFRSIMISFREESQLNMQLLNTTANESEIKENKSISAKKDK